MWPARLSGLVSAIAWGLESAWPGFSFYLLHFLHPDKWSFRLLSGADSASLPVRGQMEAVVPCNPGEPSKGWATIVKCLKMPGTIFKKLSKANRVGTVNPGIQRSVRKISTPAQELTVGVRDCSCSGRDPSSQRQKWLEKGLEGD